MDDIKVFAKNKKELETLIQTIIIYRQDKGKMSHVHNEKWKKMNNKRIELLKKKKIRTLGEKEKYK